MAGVLKPVSGLGTSGVVQLAECVPVSASLDVEGTTSRLHDASQATDGDSLGAQLPDDVVEEAV